ncbi:MAG: hypothetical protein GKC53_05465 [Neisseriaceae bacterium]|nr:MAG: hypothetical protein GKC53_05465 [Neisseriaceae bacterium]
MSDNDKKQEELGINDILDLEEVDDEAKTLFGSEFTPEEENLSHYDELVEKHILEQEQQTDPEQVTEPEIEPEIEYKPEEVEQESEIYQEIPYEDDKEETLINDSFQKITPTSVPNNKINQSWLKWILLSILLVMLIVFIVKYGIKNVLLEHFNQKEEVFSQETTDEKPNSPHFDTFSRGKKINPEIDKDEFTDIEDKEEIDFALLKSYSSITNSSTQTNNSEGGGNSLTINAEHNENSYDVLASDITGKTLSRKNALSKDRYSNDTYDLVVADKITFNPDLALEKGTFIACSLRTRIISTIAGEVSCVIPNDVYSASGNVLLIEKGSKVFGTYESGELKIGEERIFVVWNEIRTPNGVNINIASNATGELGESGIGGYVDEHFSKRFGTALLVSFLSDFASYSSESMSDKIFHKKQNNKKEKEDRSKDVVNAILIKQMDIEPTLYKNQGDMVGIFVARDVDFSKVYSLRKKGMFNGDQFR